MPFGYVPTMPYAFAHRAIVASGSMAGGEVWSCTLRAGGSFSSTTQDMTNAIGAAWVAFFAATNSGMAPTTVLGSVKIYGINPSGPADGPLNAAITTQVGGGAATVLPNQCAVVVSLLTALGGARNRGRIYLPATSLAVGSTGRLTATQVNGIADRAKTLLDAINLALGVSGTLSVESTVSGVTGQRITQIRVGDVVDTQRRRRDAMIENYQVRPVVAGP